MISCGAPQEFVPFGREYLQHHPGEVGLPSPNPMHQSPHLDLLRQLHTVSLKTSKEAWQVRQSKDGLMEEELYVSDSTVIWSRGQVGVEGARRVIKCFSCDSTVQQVLFATFHTYPEQPALLGEVLPDEPTGEELPSVCVVENDFINVYTEEGEDYAVALPFQVNKVWPLKYGVLLERNVPSSELASPKPENERIPTLYSLLHPLDEINPIIQRTGHSSIHQPSYTSDLSSQVVFTSNMPSVIIFYNSVVNSHSVWKIRRAKQDENTLVLNAAMANSMTGMPNIPSPSYSYSHTHSRLASSPVSPSTSALSPVPTPTRSRSSLLHPAQATPKAHHTPKSHMAMLSRTQSPSVFGAQHLRLGMSPSPCRSPLHRSPRSSSVSALLNDTCLEPEPLIPDLCIELLWKENTPGRASKAFFTEDSVGQRFLCLLLSRHSLLRCIKYDHTNNMSSIIFGSITSIPAKDAEHLSNLKMMLVVDGNSNLALYNGIVQVCRVHISGLPAFNSSLFRDFSSLNISSRLHSPATTPHRRSSVITSSRPPSAADAKFEVVGLSPVTHERSHIESFSDDPALPLSAAIVALLDPTNTHVTLEHASGSYFRIELPRVSSSPIVAQCLTALKYILPRDIAIQLVNKWYSTRNAPGNGDFSPYSEWHLFSKTLLDMMGYDIDKLTLSCPLECSGSCSPVAACKKFRAAENGSDSDWEYLLSSTYHMAAGNSLSEVLGLQPVGMLQREQGIRQGTANAEAPLFCHLPAILYTLHLVYEELKLNTLHWEMCGLLVAVLDQLAADLRVPIFLHHYWRDFPTLVPLHGPPTQVSPEQASRLTLPGYFTHEPPNVLVHIYTIMTGQEPDPFPYIPNVCSNTKNLILLYSVAATDCSLQDISVERFLQRISPTGHKPNTCNISMLTSRNQSDPNIHEKVVLLTDQLGLTERDIQLLPPGISLMLMNAQHLCRPSPPQDWPASAYHLIQRPDLVAHKKTMECGKQKNSGVNDPFNIKVTSLQKSEISPEMQKISQQVKEEEDGMESLDIDMLSLRWPEDQRIVEVQRMLSSSKPVTINIPQRPDVSDHDYVEEQERHLYALCIRTMALPVARGMFTLCTTAPVITETLPIPRLNLTGKAPPRGTSIDLSNIEVPPNMNMWPSFHNGVAAGLKIAPNCGEIDSTWIVYNKPKGSTEIPTEHPGFLMALGLTGHLRNLATVNMHDYLTRGHEMTCVGLLLGIAASKRGTMDVTTTKLLSVHLECLLPPTSTELDVPHTVQVAAILGVGLVYQDTAHRHMAEVLLQEIGRPPGPEMENSNDRESYSLAAGLALGLVMFGQGGEKAGFTDLNLAGELYHFIEGGHKKPLSGVHKDKYKSPSYQIKEGDRVNIDVTAPGATLALGMIYFGSANKAVAEWMVAPDTPFLLDQVRPDFLLLRTIALGLIMWEDVVPSSAWMESHVPPTVNTHVHRAGSQSTPGIDYESMHQAYCNILAGACMVLGLKFAGSANSEAFRVLYKYTRMFTNFTKRSVAELAGKSTIETCLNVILLSLSMVMAGTGDLEVLRIIRYLRSRVGPTNSTVGYGSHLAIHMALGFLFLGGGRFSLSTSNMAVAALLIACFPKFPTHSNDNRYHLQALRHLYVLAAEPRLLLPVDIDSGRLCQANVTIKFSETSQYPCQTVEMKAPCMLPELSKLCEVTIEGHLSENRYWPVSFSKNKKSWDVLRILLCAGDGIAVKLKDGRYAYKEVPSGLNVQLAPLVTKDKSARWTIKGSILEEVSGSATGLVRALVGSSSASRSGNGKSASVSIKNASINSSSSRTNSEEEEALTQTLATIIYEYLALGKPQTITNWVALIQGLRRVGMLTQWAALLVWQIKLMTRAAHFLHRLGTPQPMSSSSFLSTSTLSPEGMEEETDGSKREPEEGYRDKGHNSPLISPEQALSLHKRLESLIDSWYEEVESEVASCLRGEAGRQYTTRCALILTFHDLPSPHPIIASAGDCRVCRD
ncbi:anaphase promoting complex subunit 1 isoform X2 [Oratosquilla oratoria]|uniref:anaphase promoting complex subunit 1 isoform X2 n=1 Tax=Oratosquilla oratoria TaxID=337810 RepID=UPI003F763EAD